jgi:hypothetical protein
MDQFLEFVQQNHPEKISLKAREWMAGHAHD